MPIVKVLVNQSVSVCALLDTASSNSFCTKRLVESLGIRCAKKTQFKLNTLSSCESKLIESVTLDITSEDGETLQMLNVYFVDCIPASCGRLNVEQYAHLNDVHFAANTAKNNVSVDLLIGQDNAEALVPLDVR